MKEWATMGLLPTPAYQEMVSAPIGTWEWKLEFPSLPLPFCIPVSSIHAFRSDILQASCSLDLSPNQEAAAEVTPKNGPSGGKEMWRQAWSWVHVTELPPWCLSDLLYIKGVLVCKALEHLWCFLISCHTELSSGPWERSLSCDSASLLFLPSSICCLIGLSLTPVKTKKPSSNRHPVVRKEWLLLEWEEKDWRSPLKWGLCRYSIQVAQNSKKRRNFQLIMSQYHISWCGSAQTRDF